MRDNYLQKIFGSLTICPGQQVTTKIFQKLKPWCVILKTNFTIRKHMNMVSNNSRKYHKFSQTVNTSKKANLNTLNTHYMCIQEGLTS